MNNKFVVLTTNRSGSVWLMSRLNSLPNVIAQGELFLQKKRSLEKRWDSDFAISRFFESKPHGIKIRPFSVFSYLNNLYSNSGTNGFKLMYKQLGLFPEILLYLIREHIQVIHLVRRNHLDVLVSFAIKAQIGKSHLLSGQDAPDSIRVELNTENLVQQMEFLRRKQELARRILRWTRLTHIEVAYEDLIRDHDCFDQICEFLSVKSKESLGYSNVVKIRKGNHNEVIRNFDEVYNVISNTRFSILID